MSKVLVGVISFAAGAAAGYFYAKKKFASTEIVEIEPENEEESEEEEEAPAPNIVLTTEKPDILSYSKIIKENKYDVMREDKNKNVYVIEPDEFGQFDDYSTNYLTLYSDGYLVPDDDDRHPWELEEEHKILGGSNWTTHLGEYEDGIVHIRNDILKADYEIAESLSPFHDPSEE